MIQENEIPKYLKSTESNISKSNRKSSTNIIMKNAWFKANPYLQERLILIQVYIPTVPFVEK